MAKKRPQQNNNPDLWDGPERRSYAHRCYDHGKHEERMASHGARIRNIEDSKPVPFVNFKWISGTIIVVLLTMFSTFYYSTTETQKALTDIKIKQERVIIKLDALAVTVKEAEKVNKAEIAQIHKKVNQTIQEVLEGIKHPIP